MLKWCLGALLVLCACEGPVYEDAGRLRELPFSTGGNGQSQPEEGGGGENAGGENSQGGQADQNRGD